MLYFIRKWHRKTSLTWHLLLAVLHVNQFTKCCILDNYFLPMSLNECGPISLCACLMELGCFGFYLLNKSTNPILPLVASFHLRPMCKYDLLMGACKMCTSPAPQKFTTGSFGQSLLINELSDCHSSMWQRLTH